ncbi:MAG: D-2-hydroxyacid dehydrogenase family protein [Myxococcaceae bacterium]|nr:D-2-hydroxyacid dehydrogenase family protein [Myxococcaceae bacterium]
MRPRILIAEPGDFSPVALAALRQQADVELREVPPAGLAEAGREFDALWFRLAHRIDRTFLDARGRCRVVATPVTGIDHIDIDACRSAGVKVVSLKGETEFLKEVRATAELTLGLALALLRHIPAASASVAAGEWARDRFRGHELYRKTAGIVGVGRLGTIVAGYLEALGMSVVGYDVRPDFPPGLRRAPTLQALLNESDLVSVHVSLEASTRNLLGAEAFAAMKPGAVLVNTSRGGVVDEAAMLAALASGRLGGAALDVLTGEPGIDARHPVVAESKRRTNLLVLPHLGGNTHESFEKTELFLAGKVLEALR